MVDTRMTTLLVWLALLPALADAADPDDLLHEARARVRHGDYEGVRIVAEEALAIEGDHQRAAQYLIALSWEMGGAPDRALPIYESLIDAWPRRQVPDDLVFRRAECLGRLHRYRQARRQLRALGEPAERPALDQLKIEVLQGVWDLELGRDRRGYRELAEALDAADPGTGRWYQALARHAILVSAVEQARAHDLGGRGGPPALEARAALVEVAKTQLVELIRLEEPAFSLEGFLLLGRTHADLGQAMLDASLYPERVEAVWTKGTMYFDRGLELAARSAWTGEPVPTLRAELEALTERVER